MEHSENLEGVHLVVEGRVQGVFFRASTQSTAVSLGLTGWVRNVSDGTVEVHAVGDRDALDRFIRWCWQGPPGARVTGVRVSEVPVIKAFSGFHIRY